MICERCGAEDNIKRSVLGKFVCKTCFDDYKGVLSLQRRSITNYWDDNYVRPKTIEDCHKTPCWTCMYLVGKRCRDGFYDGLMVVT